MHSVYYKLILTERRTLASREKIGTSRVDINWCSPITWKQHFCPASQSTNKPDCHHKTCFYCSALLSSHIPERTDSVAVGRTDSVALGRTYSVAGGRTYSVAVGRTYSVAWGYDLRRDLG